MDKSDFYYTNSNSKGYTPVELDDINSLIDDWFETRGIEDDSDIIDSMHSVIANEVEKICVKFDTENSVDMAPTKIKPDSCQKCSYCIEINTIDKKITCSNLMTTITVPRMNYITPRCPLEEIGIPFELEINTPVKLPRVVASQFSEMISDGMTLVIEAVYREGLVTLRSTEVKDNQVPLSVEEQSAYNHFCTTAPFLVTIDTMHGDDYRDVFQVNGIFWDDYNNTWIDDDLAEWSPLGE